jgi:hypothetical protein
MKNEGETWQLGMRVLTECERYNPEYARINIEVVKVEGAKVGFFLHHGKQPDFCDLLISCQMDTRNINPYGHDIIYRTRYASIGLVCAESMVKTLRLINRKMESRSDKFGYCQTFEDYTLRVADVLCVKRFVFSKFGCEDYHTADFRNAKNELSRTISDLIGKLQPILQKAA